MQSARCSATAGTAAGWVGAAAGATATATGSALLAQLEITYCGRRDAAGGHGRELAGHAGPDRLRATSTTARRTTPGCERPGWCDAGHDDSEWSSVRSLERDLARWSLPTGPPVRRTRDAVVRRRSPPPLRARPSSTSARTWSAVSGSPCSGEAGQTVTIRHAEVLEDGELCTRPLRTAKATDRYILRGRRAGDLGAALHLPRLPLRRGRRLARGTDARSDICAVVCHSDLERTGWFECSDPLYQSLPREHRLEHARQFPRRAHRLPAARRAARLDGRHPALLPCRLLPLRQRRLPGFLAGRPGRGSGSRRRGAVCRAERPDGSARRGRRLGRRRGRRPLDPVPAFGDPGILAAQYDSMARGWTTLPR